MPKSIKNKSRSKRSALKLESLEQRQLLAAITGGGTEVISNFTAANGNTYDQVLMTGSTVTVGADGGQVTRVDFLDKDGDLVRAEFAGSGTLSISLSDFSGPAAPEKYATTTQYVMGNATFTITGGDASTNFSLHSLGTANVHNKGDNPLFAGGTKTGGDNIANVARLVIVGDTTTPLGSDFGGVRAGNAVFSDTKGAVGIIAPNVQFTGPIILGDIDAKENGRATLQIGSYSDTTVVQVTGGDLKRTNALDWNVTANTLTGIMSTTGQKSNGALINPGVIDAGAVTDFGLTTGDVSYKVSGPVTVIDSKTDDLSKYAEMFLGDVVIKNGLAAGQTFAAKLMGNVTVEGDLAGLITTDWHIGGTSNDDEFGIGDVTVQGKILSGGAIESSTSIGKVTIQGGMDFTTNAYAANAGAAAIISTIGRADQDSSIGDISFGADVKFAAATATLVNAGVENLGTGSVGTISGAQVTKTTGAVRFINEVGSIGAITFSTATIAEVTADGSIGAIKTTGSGSGDHLVLGTVDAQNGTVGAITTNKNLTVDALTGSKGIGAISGATVTLNGAVTATTGNIGTITATGDLLFKGDVAATAGTIGAISSGGNLTFQQDVTAKSIGAISVTGKQHDLKVEGLISATDTSIGAINVSGEDSDIIITGAGFSAKTSIGDVTVAHGKIVGVAGQVEFSANKIGDVSVTADKATTGALLSNVIFRAMGDTEATVGSAVIGDITLDTSANTAGAFVATGAAADSAVDGNGFSSSGSIGDITITGSATQILDTGTGLVFRAGSSALGATGGYTGTAATTYANGMDFNGGVSIGDVSVMGNLDGLASAGGAAGEGLVIAAGVRLGSGGVFAVRAGSEGNIVAATKTGTSSMGSVSIENLGENGASIRGFNSANVSADVFAAGSVIIADTISSIEVVTGLGTETVEPSGSALKGVVELGDGNEASDDLYVVVL